MDTVIELIKQFKMPLIVIVGALVLFVTFGTVVPMIQEANANKTPIEKITAENKREYRNTDEILPQDFKVTAIHEDGAKTNLPSSEVELSRTTLNPVGDTTTVTLTWIQDSSVTCDVDVKVDRKKIVGFQCGYPNVDNVVAVLYSNGELCFEGEGDTLISEKGRYLWQQKYDGSKDYPIRSVTFEKTVRPRVMDYWFCGIDTITYIAPIPDSVQSMKGTFQNCTQLTTMADWTNCSGLLNISECYQGCENLKYTVAVPASVKRATKAFDGCISLQKTPNLTTATSLTLCDSMFSSCEKLVSITMPPNANDISNMFNGCRNLQIMPSIPNSVVNMERTFRDCTALKTLADVPMSVTNMTSCFENCYYIEGTAIINASPENVGNCFNNSCESTHLDLGGSSLILDAFANTCKYGNITVNGQKPIPEITSLSAYEKYIKNLEKMKEQENK